MKKLSISAVAAALLLAGCGDDAAQTITTSTETPASASSSKTLSEVSISNPFFSDYQTPYGIPPFEKIKLAHYKPAFMKGIAEHKAEIEQIANNTAPATFENTIVAMERAGQLLSKVEYVFYNLTSANTSDEMQALSKEMSPLLSSHSDDINLNAKLFARVKSVYDNQERLNLNTAQAKLLKDNYISFTRNGANLNDTQKTTLRSLNEQLSKLSIEFGENALKEVQNFKLVIDKKEDLAGLSDSVIAAAADTAKKQGLEGKWVFTTSRPSFTPFVTYADNRELRQQMFEAYTNVANNDNEFDNKEIVAKMAALRAEKAQLLGYKTHAHYVLEERTAKTPENAYALLNKVWPAAIARAKAEVKDMQALANKQGDNITIAAWDHWYYAEKIRKAKYDLDEELTRPYFSLEATLDGVFYTVNQLFGLTVKERHDLPKYHDDVRTFEVFDKDGSLLGIFLTDHYVRDSKRAGAWMNAYRKQHKVDGKNIKPIIVNVLNYPRPTADQPSLLTFDQASTLFHEFGHALHGLLSDGVYESQTGTAVPRDFVEYPSQVMENWMTEPQVLAKFAKHYQTGEVIPQAMIEKIQAAAQFNQGFGTTEYLAAAYLDLYWHTLETTDLKDTAQFEKAAMAELGLIDEIAPRYRSTYFRHIFSGGYSAGYYSYIWSEQFDADTYDAFKENGIFDQKTAQSFRDNILSQGGTDDALTLFKKFRGRDAKVEPLLKKKGLVVADKASKL
ncbi:M3 family metallopeptidase [Flocculibacter collagenilyticus]|uniref:M3 family metallopeptidase n=1 Tax=Flocculibacter collagenilyticus TaxID=2744479 RepID=UPI0018F642BD|nr:M3 family metallopeptidase [Flocculibacter collagenilyticus]